MAGETGLVLERPSIASLLRRISGVRLLVVGDFMLDRNVYGVASRISPEAPSPVILVQQSKDQLGGAGNVVRNIGTLGGKVYCAAVVGDDVAGRLLEDRLRAARGCESLEVIRERERKTTVKTRIVAVQGGRPAASGAAQGHQQVLRLDEETRTSIQPQSVSQVLDFARQVITQVQGVVVSDYAKGALPPSLLSELTALARRAGKLVFVDPKERNFERYRGASVLTPNASETETALDILIGATSEEAQANWEAAVQQRLADWDFEAMLITRGSEGVSLIERQGFHHFPTSAREVFDVTGAGDTVLAAFSLAVASGATYAEAAQFGNLAAGVAVSKAGAAVVYPFEIERELAMRHATAESKLRTRDEIKIIADALRRENKRIVFTNGCFDLLHVGHMHLLREAKKLGDVLIVGLNSDASVKRLKGPERPIVNQPDRADAIAALESVDYLVVFDELDPMELLRTIRPDVLVKGNDYQEAQVVGSDFLKSYGGTVHLVPLRQGVSTSRIVEKIRTENAAASRLARFPSGPRTVHPPSSTFPETK